MHKFSVYLSLWSAAMRSDLQYRANFLMLVVFGLLSEAVGLLAIWVILSRFNAIAGCTLGEVAFLYALRMTVHSLQALLFSGVENLPWWIREGTFDRFMVRPVPPILMMTTDRIGMTMVGKLIGAIALLLAVDTLVEVDWTPLAVLYVSMAIAGGVLIEAAIRLATVALNFRILHPTEMLTNVSEDILMNFGSYSLRIHGDALRILLIFGFPLAFIAYFPATVLLARTDELSVHPNFAYLAPLAGFILFTLAYRFWDHELRYYKSAGS